ncbi:alanine dehydrogenase [Taibaiella sp. KBW10]|uniref:NAD(P)-dependent oxidoreductase n=1 Tax=Taibaiella sp. KBW10 TaxID=2153357 RepID=UPI000F5ADB75|nr:NAD(P)-dependent oxidoreductase [Taibaiella sp. KBW10]RQO30763.1 alanine dehydrogenase [Taibaiella sp. KBW10]
MKIGLIKEGKIPTDTRVALTPEQCIDIVKTYPQLSIVVQPSPNRSYADQEYIDAGVNLQEDLSDCDVLLGIKEVPVAELIPGKTYFFFSHTKKKQAYNQKLMHALIEKKITMIDYEALTYDNGQRIIGFGFFAGVVGAHNALLTYGKKNELFTLKPAYECKDMAEMVKQYRDIQLPPIKIVVTGDGRVAHGILHIMEMMDIDSVAHNDFLEKEYPHPVYTNLKNETLYRNKNTKEFHRDEFHAHPEQYECLFQPYISSDILINGIYWDAKIQRLFEKDEVNDPAFKLNVISDVTCDIDGSVPVNLGASTIADPVYGYDKTKGTKTAPFINDAQIIDIMAVDNLPNELPRDASNMFGSHIIKHIIPELLAAESTILDRATICSKGILGSHFEYLSDYAY